MTARALTAALLVAVASAGGCGAPEGAADSDRGTLRLLVAPEEGSPVVGRNAFQVDVRSADGTPLAGLSVSAVPWMVTHNHGSTEKAVVEDRGGGRYRAFPVTLFMAGEWQLAVRAEGEGESGVAVRHYLVP